MENNDSSGYLREKHGTLSLPQEPAPNSPLLQGEGGSSHTSPELSSLEGVWIVRKGEKMRESGGKRKEAGTAERFPLKKTLLMERSFCSACLGGFYSQTPFTNYQNNIANIITMGEN